MSAADLTARTAGLLEGQGGAQDAHALLADLRSEAAALEAERAAAEAQSLDLTKPGPTATKHHARAGQLTFEIIRLTRQVEAVSERLEAIQAAESAQAAASRQEAVLTARDELASDLEQHYPAAAATIVGLLERLRASDAQLRAVGLNPDHIGAEATTRGFVPNVGGAPGTLAGALRLVDLCSRDP